MTRTRKILNFSFSLILILCIASAVSLICVHPNPEEWGSFPFSELGTLAAACVAALGALAVAQTYGEKKSAEIGQRKWEIDESIRSQRETSYTLLAHEYLSIFQGGSPRDLAEVRATAALWASESVIQAMAQWNSLLREIPNNPNNPTEYKITSEYRADVHRSIGRIISAMRFDLDSKVINERDIAAMIFNDFVNEEEQNDHAIPDADY